MFEDKATRKLAKAITIAKDIGNGMRVHMTPKVEHKGNVRVEAANRTLELHGSVKDLSTVHGSIYIFEGDVTIIYPDMRDFAREEE